MASFQSKWAVVVDATAQTSAVIERVMIERVVTADGFI